MHRGIAVGVETLLADDPRLTCRGVDAASPTPVIFDRRLRTPQTARVFSLHPLVCILTTEEALASGGSRYPRERTLLLPLLDPQGGSLELAGALEGLKERAGLDTLMVEGGGKLLASFLRSQLWDLAAVTIAPRYLGGYQIGSDLDEQVCVESVEKLGEDLLLIARREGRHE